MKNSTNPILSRLKKVNVALIMGLMLYMLSLAHISFGQTFASGVRSGTTGCGGFGNPACGSLTGVANAGDAADGSGSDITKATIVSNKTALGLVGGNAYITLRFAQAVPAGTTVYIKVDQPAATGLISSLLGVVGLFDDGHIAGQLLSGASATSDGSNVATASTRFLTDQTRSNFYIAVTPATNSDAFNAVRISVAAPALNVVSNITLNVYHVFYDSTAPENCIRPYHYTSLGEQTGVQVNLSATIVDPEKAIDGIVDANNYSVIQNGLVNVASVVSQTIFLGKTVPGTYEVLATISRPADLANLNVLSNITVQAFAGNSPIGSARTVNELLLSLELLGSFEANNLVTLAFAPGSSYDRIVITSTSLANVTAFTGIRVHEAGAHPPVMFTGGFLAGPPAGNYQSHSLTDAAYSEIPILMPGFSIGCGTPADFTFKMFNADQASQVTGNLMPASLILTSGGTLQGPTSTADAGMYTFDVQATNMYGQTAVATFALEITTALPVTLVNFKAKAEGQTALLDWSTSAETNSDRFDIERSQNGKAWSKIGSLVSNHESATLQRYSFTDSSPVNGENLYRLKMIDRDNSFAYSSIENLHFDVSNALSVYPNPVINSENLQISNVDWSNVKSVNVINSAGKTVFQSFDKLTAGLKTDHFSAGLYIIKIIQKDGKIGFSKFLKL